MPYKDPVKAREYYRDWQNKNRPKIKASARKSKLKRLYGMTQEQFDLRLAGQDFSCAICRVPTPTTKMGWHIDHRHSDGVVRGILCHHCNAMLGYSRDNPATLIAAANYLGNADGP